MGNVIHAVERFRQPHTPRAEGQPSEWVCIDDRYAVGVEGLYRQIGGGAVGIGDAVAKANALRAWRIGRKSDVIELAQRKGLSSAPVQVIGSIAAKTLQNEGVYVYQHDLCAREGSARAITQIEAQGSAELLRRARVIKPDLGVQTFAQISGISQLLLDADRVMAAGEAAQLLDEGGTWRQQDGLSIWAPTVEPIRRVGLVDSPHISPNLLADWGRDVAFDVRAAFEAGEAAYHVSLGDMPDEIAAPLSDVIPFHTEDFMAAVAVNHAATSMALDSVAPAGHDRIDIHRIA